MNDGNNEIHPSGAITVKIPIEEAITEPYLVVEQADGSYRQIESRIQDGFYVFVTNNLRKVGILSKHAKSDDPELPADPDLETPSDSKPSMDTEPT